MDRYEDEDFDYNDEIDHEEEKVEEGEGRGDGVDVSDEEDESKEAHRDGSEEEEEKEKRRKPPRSERRIKQLHRELKQSQAQLEELKKYSEVYVKELEELRKRDYERTKTTTTSSIDQQLNTLEKQLKVAFDDADSDAYTSINRKIRELERQKIVETLKPSTDYRPLEPPKFQEPQQPTQTRAEADWMKRNDWFNKAGYKPFTETAVQIWEDLQNAVDDDGEPLYTVDSPELYAELDKQLHMLYPQLRPKKNVSSNKRHDPVSHGSRGAGARSGDTSRPNKLSQKQLESMAKYGFDPRSEEDRRIWLENKDGGPLEGY